MLLRDRAVQFIASCLSKYEFICSHKWKCLFLFVNFSFPAFEGLLCYVGIIAICEASKSNFEIFLCTYVEEGFQPFISVQNYSKEEGL